MHLLPFSMFFSSLYIFSLYLFCPVVLTISVENLMLMCLTVTKVSKCYNSN